MLATVTEFTRQAQEILRNPENFGWYVVALLVLVLYVYAVEAERRRWDVILAGLALWLADWINEIANALVLHITGRAAVWTVTGDTAYLILIGLAIEISFMFAVAGIIYVKLLPADRATRILGMPNRLAIGLVLSIAAVGVEVLLRDAGVFHWEYWWWNWPFVLPIIVAGYLWFFLVAAYVYDMRDVRRQALFVGVMAAFVASALIVFGVILGWI
jgi:hypothetical protein